eukprot:5247016-Alexandrium_andersonii.AAC.1
MLIRRLHGIHTSPNTVNGTKSLPLMLPQQPAAEHPGCGPRRSSNIAVLDGAKLRARPNPV